MLPAIRVGSTYTPVATTNAMTSNATNPARLS